MYLDLSMLYIYLQKTLSLKRLVHSVSTAACAKILAQKFNMDQEKAFFAGLAHDIARDLPEPDILRLAANEEISPQFRGNSVLLHSFAGAALLKKDFNIDDPVILNSIRWHTCGNPLMDGIAKIVYIADYIESSRLHISGSEGVEIMEMTLHSALYNIIGKEKKYYESKKKNIFTVTEELFAQVEGMLNNEKN